MLKQTESTSYFLIEPIKPYLTLTTTTTNGRTTNTYTRHNRPVFRHSWGSGKANFEIDRKQLVLIYKEFDMYHKVKFYFVRNESIFAYLGNRKAIKIAIIDPYLDIEEGETTTRYGIDLVLLESLSIQKYFGNDGIGDYSGKFFLNLPVNVYSHQIKNGIEWTPEEGMQPCINTESLWYEDEDGKEIFHEPTEKDYKYEIDYWLEYFYQGGYIIVDDKIKSIKE